MGLFCCLFVLDKELLLFYTNDVASNKKSTLHSKDNMLLGVNIHVNIFSFQSVLAL